MSINTWEEIAKHSAAKETLAKLGAMVLKPIIRIDGCLNLNYSGSNVHKIAEQLGIFKQGILKQGIKEVVEELNKTALTEGDVRQRKRAGASVKTLPPPAPTPTIKG